MKILCDFLLKLMSTLLFTFVAVLWATKEYTIDTISSSCIECSYQEDVTFLSILGSVLLTFIFFVIRITFKNKRFKIALQTIFVVGVWFLLTNIIVEERITSWSTFTNLEEMFLTIHLSFLPILVLTPILIMSRNFSVITILNRKNI